MKPSTITKNTNMQQTDFGTNAQQYKWFVQTGRKLLKDSLSENATNITVKTRRIFNLTVWMSGPLYY